MTDIELKDILKLKGIYFKKLDIKKDNIFYPVESDYYLHSKALTRYPKNISIYSIKKISVLDITVPVIQVAFVNDTILYLKYESLLEATYNPKNYKSDYSFTDNVDNDLNLIKTIAEGWEKKYGIPQSNNGNLNGFYPNSAPFLQYKNENHSIIQYTEHRKWNTKNNDMEIYFGNTCVKDTIFYNSIIKTTSYTKFGVIFNRDLVSKINKYSMLEDQKEEIINNNKKINNQQKFQKKIDSL